MQTKNWDPIRSLKPDQKQKEQQRQQAVKKELARNNPRIDNNINRGYN